MGLELMKALRGCGVDPALKSYGPALFGSLKMGFAGKAYKEAELAALLKLGSEQKSGDQVYELMQRLRATVSQVTEDTARVLEDCFSSETGVDKRNLNGGGGWRVLRTHVDQTGVCVSCREKLVSLDIRPREMKNFATSLENLASSSETSHFLIFQEWLQRSDPFDVVVDAANVSRSYQQDFNFAQLNSVVNKLRHISPTKKSPLVILHKSRVDRAIAQHPGNRRLLRMWKKGGTLYVLPSASNDDWYWLYAAVTRNCLLVTNDKMTDKLFQLLGTSFFPRWKEKHQVRLDFSKGIIRFFMPPPYSNVIQESEQGSWHIPTVTGDDLEIPRQWLCATRSRKTQ